MVLWVVRCFTVNVGLGDGAIYLLLDADTHPWTIESAVLIDGGTETGATKLQHTINEIKATYLPNGGELKFTSIVITHWDGDHFLGVQELIRMNLKSNGTTGHHCDIMHKYEEFPNDDDPRTTIYWPTKPVGTKVKVDSSDKFLFQLEVSSPANSNKGVWSNALCHTRQGAAAIGTDLFSGKLLATMEPNLNLRDMMEKKGLTDETRPVFLIVGCNLKLINAKDIPMRVGGTEANASSIMCLLFTPKKAYTTGRYDLYCGGDAEDEQEWVLVNFLEASKAEKLAVIKAGHHGSKFATTERFYPFKPEAFIISAAEDYGHPSFSVLFFMLTYLIANYTLLSQDRIYCTRFPYWMIKRATESVLIRTKDLDITTVLDETVEPLRKILESITSWPNVIEDWFPGATALMKEAYKMMTKKQFKEYKARRDSQKDEDIDDSVYKAGEKLIKEWGRLQNSVIMRMIQVWPTIGSPKYPLGAVMDGETNHNEVFYVFTEFAAEDHLQIFTATYNAESNPGEWKTRFLGDHRVKPDAAIVKNTVDNLGLTVAEINRLKQQIAFEQALMHRIEQLQKIQNQGGDMAFTKVTNALFALPADDLVSTACSKFLTGLPRAPGSQVDSTNLLWLQDACGASAVDIKLATTPQEERIASEVIIVIPSGSQELQFTSRTEAIQKQFGADAVQNTRSDGYNNVIEGVMLGLEAASTITLGLGQFLNLMQYDYVDAEGKPSTNFKNWLSPIFDAIPLEIASDATTAGKKGLWIQPHLEHRVILRLEACPQREGVTKLEQFFAKHIGEVKFEKLQVIGLSTATCYAAPPSKGVKTKPLGFKMMKQTKITFIGDTRFDHSADPTTFIFSLTNESVTFKLRPAKGTTLSSAVDWIISRLKSQKAAVDSAKDESKALQDILQSIGSSVMPRQISITVGQQSVLAFGLDLEIALSAGAEPGKHVAFHGGLHWERGATRVLAEIWSNGHEPIIGEKLNPYYDTYQSFKPSGEGLQDYISIPYLFDPKGSIKLPAGIPDRISRASLEFSLGAVRFLNIEATLACSLPESKESLPPVMLQEIMLIYNRNFTDKYTQFYFRGVVALQPPRHLGGVRGQAYMGVSLKYEATNNISNWTLSAEATGLEIAHLYTLLPTDGSNHAIMNFMSNISIKHVGATYEYNSSGLPSKLTLDGVLQIGPVELKLDYYHKGAEWEFKASVKPNPDLREKKTTLKELLHDFVDDDTMSSVPNFVQNFELNLDELGIDLICFRDKLNDKPDAPSYIVFVFVIKVNKFSVTFAQLQERNGAFPKSGTKSKAKRLLRLSLSAFPKVEVPIVQELPKPFDELDFLWASEDITIDEVVLINKHAFKDKSPVSYQESQKKEGVSPALVSGCHFQVILNEQSQPKCILDYAFNGAKHATKKADMDAANTNPNDQGVSTAAALPGASQDGGTKSAPMSRTTKGLSISNISLSMKDKGKLSITLDAKVMLGPLAFELIGFTVNLDLNLFKNFDPTTFHADFGLSGMAVAFSRPPATLAGMFVHKDLGGGRSQYMGGLAIGVGVWEFLAAGVYEEYAGWNSIFVFAKLNGPLISFGFAEVNGIVGGFGYNSAIRMPAVTEVTDFPFVQINTNKREAASNIIDQFKELTNTGEKGWFKAAKDSYWLAAGLGVKAFHMVEIQAVLVIDLSPNPKLGIFAEAVAKMPKGVEDEKAFLFTDLAIAATFDPGHGILQIAGQLTPRSYILHKSCRLTGSFVLAYYFAASGHDGDWVFSVGGYHPKFRAPAHYPSPPPRLGISWIYDSEISITGEAYFAITPQACMGGGRLDAVYHSGRTKASFSAYADFLIYYDPFQFQASVGVSVHVSTVIGRGIFSKEISLEVSADVDLHGPPLAGVAHIHVWFTELSIHFGPEKQIAPKLEWDAFHKLFNPAVEKNEGEHFVSIPKGRLGTQQDADIEKNSGATGQAAEKLTLVRGTQLELQIETRFPVMSLSLNDKDQRVMEQGKAKSVFSTPMQIRNGNPFKRSELKITIELVSGSTRQVTDLDLDYITKNVPGALWNPFDDRRSMLDQPNTQEHLMGVKMKAPKPEMSTEDLPAVNSAKFNCLPIGGAEHKFPEIEIPVSGQRMEPVPGLSMPDLQKGVVAQWEELRRQFTGGGQTAR